MSIDRLVLLLKLLPEIYAVAKELIYIFTSVPDESLEEYLKNLGEAFRLLNEAKTDEDIKYAKLKISQRISHL